MNNIIDKKLLEILKSTDWTKEQAIEIRNNIRKQLIVEIENELPEEPRLIGLRSNVEKHFNLGRMDCLGEIKKILNNFK